MQSGNLGRKNSTSPYAANSANFGIEQSKFNEHYLNMANGNRHIAGRHMSNPYNNFGSSNQDDI